ncbi:MAG: DUF2125 domain-containing protein [Paracoccaceae bacterium]|nr:DUF2125 domain-containing protein [Paracoccaceae bacterium]
MSTRFIFGIAAIAVSASVAVPAYADLTAQQAWDAASRFYKTAGYKIVIGQKTASDGVLTLNNVTMTQEMPNGLGQIRITFDWLKAKEVDGGTVEITMAPTIGINAKTNGEEGPYGRKPGSYRAHLLMTGFRTLVSGNPDDISIDSTVPQAVLVMDELSPNGHSVPVKSNFVIKDFSSQYAYQPPADGKLEHSNGTTSIASITGDFRVDNPNAPEFVSVAASLADLSYGFTAAMPDFAKYDPGDRMFGLSLLKDGMSVEASGIIGKTSISVVTSLRSGNSDYYLASADTRLGLALSKERLRYDISAGNLKINVQSPDLPVPDFKLALDKLSVDVLLPFAQKSAPADFKVDFAARGLSASDSLWAMFDPNKVLSHDPITVAVSLSGKVMVLMDMMDKRALMQANGPPWVPTAINLDELTISALGVLLTGKGSFKGDLGSGKTMDGLPVPVGSVNLDLKGAFGLIDKLIGMGLVQSDQAMGIKGMLAAFARPVDEDHFASKIEVTEDGAVLANGQRIR